MIYLKETVNNESSPDLPKRAWIQFGTRDSSRFNLSAEFVFDDNKKNDFASFYWYRILCKDHPEKEADEIIQQYVDEVNVVNSEMKEELDKVGEAARATLEAVANKYRLKALEVGDKYFEVWG